MGAVRFQNGKVLFVGGKVAMDAACCCDQSAPCSCPDGLVSSYAVSWTDTWGTGSATVTGSACGWSGGGTDGRGCMVFVDLSLVTSAPCGWLLQWTSPAPSGECPPWTDDSKATTGATPAAGAYPNGTGGVVSNVSVA